MSMISSLIDELRKLADGQAPYRDARAAMLEAADTIWQLRDDLQRANEAVRDAEHDESRAWDRVRKAEAENVKLRELVKDTLPVMENNCAMCAYLDECTILVDCKCIALKRLRDRMCELGGRRRVEEKE